MNKEQLIDAIKAMTVGEVTELVKALEKEFGVSSVPPVLPPDFVYPVAGDPEPQEPDYFDVTLKEVGPNKINVIKVLREITNLGLKEAKEIVEAAPIIVKADLGKEEAELVVGKFENVGAVAVL